MTPIILASASAARAKVLAAAGVMFQTVVSGLDEGAMKTALLGDGSSPAAVAGELAKAKALRVAARTAGVVIGADQTLEFAGRLFDKTACLAETRDLLRHLRGNTFHLYAGLALARDDRLLWSETHSARLTMRPFSEAFLDAYVERNADRLASSLGGFELEAEGAQLFDAIDGDYFAVLGLPLLPLLRALRTVGAVAS